MEKDFRLDHAACDEISEGVVEFCQKQHVDRKDTLRYRLSVEECLLNWLDKGCEGRRIRLRTGRRFFSPYIMIEMDGEPVHPDMDNSGDYGEFCETILMNLNLKPVYSYSGAKNTLYYRIKKETPNQLVVLFSVIAFAAFVGILGRLLLPDAFRLAVLDGIIDPVYNTFFNILGCIAGPMIFLSVAWGIYGIGDVETLGRIGRTMMLGYLAFVSIATACCSVLFPFFGNRFSIGGDQVTQVRAILEMILGIFPANIVEPFMTGNTLQIIFLAVVIGIALLFMQRQTRAIAIAIGQINALVQFLMGLISRLVPFVIFLVVVNLIWSENLSVVQSAWKLMAGFLIALFFLASGFLFYTSWKQKVSPAILIKKSMPTFLVAITSASSAAAFAPNVATCEKGYGIDRSLVSFGIPMGMVMHKPMTAAYDLVLVMYFASVYHVQCSPVWLLLAVFICIIVAVSTPPIPGGGTIAYTILFAQLGIPTEAMALALTLDIIVDFLLTSFDMFALQMAIINISARMGRLDRSVLRQSDN